MNRVIYDVHTHAMELKHPVFMALMQSFMSDAFTDFLGSGFLSPSYFGLKNPSKIPTSVMNALVAFEQPIADTFRMMEDDLAGKYKGGFPFIEENKLVLRGKIYDRMCICPLLMDFSTEVNNKLYYRTARRDKITGYAEDTLAAISDYQKSRPDGILTFRPFLGINPAVHTKDEIRQLISRFLVSGCFYGVKIYPPLGTDPWPEDSVKRERCILIYDYCAETGTPIITHCDNQGYRMLPTELAFEYTSPARWEKVLKEYPTLKLDFAHFGRQYSIVDKGLYGEWCSDIIRLMCGYPNVYTDISFSGADPFFYKQLVEKLNSKSSEVRKTIESRIMFGSDFAINLLKISSYNEYWRIFDLSPLSDELVEKAVSGNPSRFLGLQSKKTIRESCTDSE